MSDQITKKPIYKRWWFIAIVVLMVIGAMSNNNGEGKKVSASPTAEEGTITAIPVKIATLLADYEANEVGADNSYKGKYIQTTGIIDSVKKDIMDDLYVSLGTGADFEIPSLQAFFSDEFNDQLGTLKKGQKLKVICEVDGLMMNVLAKDCRIVK